MRLEACPFCGVWPEKHARGDFHVINHDAEKCLWSGGEEMGIFPEAYRRWNHRPPAKDRFEKPKAELKLVPKNRHERRAARAAMKESDIRWTESTEDTFVNPIVVSEG